MGILGLALLPGAAVGQDERAEEFREQLAGEAFTIFADEIEYDRERELYVASGNVRVERAKDRYLLADWMAFSPEERTGVATGNVELVDGTDHLRAQFAAVDLDTLVAKLTDAELTATSTGYLLDARTLEKTGRETYHIEDGMITPCLCPPGTSRRPFEVKAGEADVRLEGYAVARDATVYILGVPVAYTPYLVLPVKTERQSGFLPPRLGGSSIDGADIELPYFWAAREDLNVMLRPRWMTKRGMRGAVDLEYVFGKEGYSEAHGAVLPGDNEIDRDDPDTPFSDNRWAYALRHEQPLAPGTRFGADISRVSDNNYVFDFSDLPGSPDQLRFLESAAWLTGARQSFFVSLVGETRDDLQTPNDLDRDDFLLQKLPDLFLASTPRRLGPIPLQGAFDARWTYFHQLDGVSTLAGFSPIRDQFFDTGPDGTFNANEKASDGTFPGAGTDTNLDGTVGVPGGLEGNGLFDEGELLADRGHRVDLYPRLSLPAQLGPFEALVEGGLRETLYFPVEGDTSSRTLWTGRADVRTHLEGGFDLFGASVRHVIEPAVSGGFVSPQSQDRNAFFIPQGAVRQERIRDGDARARLRNPTDRIDDEKFIITALTQRFFKAAEGDLLPARQVANVHMTYGYDFDAGRTLNLYFLSELRPTDRIEIDGQIGWDTKEGNVTEALAQLGWTWERGHYVNFTYRYLREIPLVFENYGFSDDVFDRADTDFDEVNQIGAFANLAVTPRLELFGGLFASFEESRVQAAQGGFRFKSGCQGCWELLMSVQQTTRPDDTKFIFQIGVPGFGIGTDF
jgi:lipopolysaccharide export system protein LptA